MSDALAWVSEELAALEGRGLRRRLETLESPQGALVRVGGRELVNFCSNDYLGLAADARVRRGAIAAVEAEGAGAGAARLIAGDLPIHRRLEARLAALKGTEAALLFSSGWHANTGVIPALVGDGDAVFSDALNHASIVDGCRLARAGGARVVVYPHADARALGELMERTEARRKLVVTDSIFGMDGDAAPLADLSLLCERHGAMLYVDEAHATGVLGESGAGLAELLGVRPHVQMGTLGKALGSFGAFVAGSEPLVAWLVSRARSFVFTTALPPAACGASLAALELLAAEPSRRRRLASLAFQMKQGLALLGLPLPKVVAPIFPILLGDEALALSAAGALRERGFFVRAIRPPTVPPGTSRIRVSLGAEHTDLQVQAFLAALGDVLRAIAPPGLTDPAGFAGAVAAR